MMHWVGGLEVKIEKEGCPGEVSQVEDIGTAF